MTNRLVPFIADGIVDGGLAADVAPADLQTAVKVLRAARQPGSVAELANRAVYVRQFCVEVAATATASRTQTHAFSNQCRSDDSLGSVSMFSTRITRKALSIFAITLLAAGTAAAAAGGALPVFDGVAKEVVVESGDHTDVNVADGPDAADNDQPTNEDASPEGIVPAVVENQNGVVDHHGKCTAWTNGSAKNASNPSFAELQVAADAVELTIDEYCATVLGTPTAGDEPTSDDESDDSADDHKSGKGHGNSKSGNGESGKGESGKGNGNGTGNGNGNNESGKGESGKAKGNGNGNSESGKAKGNGKSEAGKGESSNGESGKGNGTGKGNSESDNSESGEGNGNGHGHGHDEG